MDRVVEGFVNEIGVRRVLSRKPAERDRGKVNTSSSSQVPVPHIPGMATTIATSRPITDRPSTLKPTRQRKHLLPLMTVLTKLLAKNFKAVRQRAREQKRQERTIRMLEILSDKRINHLQCFLQKAQTRMLRFRRLVKLSMRINRLFKLSVKLKYSQAMANIMRWRSGKAVKLCRIFQRYSLGVLGRLVEKIKNSRGRLFLGKLVGNVEQWRKRLPQAARMARSISHLIQLTKARTLIQLVGFTSPLQSKKKNRKTLRLPPTKSVSTETAEKPDITKDLLIAQLKAELEQKTKQIAKLQSQQKDNREVPSSRATLVKMTHSRSTTPQNNRISNVTQQQSEFDGRESKISQNQQPKSQCGSHQRSSKSIRSYISDNRSVFSVNTMNLLKKLDEQISPNTCCKYRSKYQEEHRLCQHLKQKLQLIEEQYEMLSAINRHFDETLQIQLNPTLAEGEVNRLEFESVKKQTERLERQLSRCRTELQQTRRQKQKQKTLFKAKLQSILDKMPKSRSKHS